MASGVTVGESQLAPDGDPSQVVGTLRRGDALEESVSPGSAGLPLRRVTPGLQTRRVEAGPRECMLSVREVAARLSVCTSTVYKLCAQGKLAHVRIANAIRVPVDEFPRLVGGERLPAG